VPHFQNKCVLSKAACKLDCHATPILKRSTESDSLTLARLISCYLDLSVRLLSPAVSDAAHPSATEQLLAKLGIATAERVYKKIIALLPVH
jgi:hypothetical protein